MNTFTDALAWLLAGAILLVLRAIAAVSAPFCRNQPRYEDDI